MGAPARITPRVYIPDNVRMETPPEYFLQRLYDQDQDLRLLPSRSRPFAYVLARKRRMSAGPVPQALKDTVLNPDTQMCWHYGLVPVCMVFKTGASWNPDPLIRSLKARDMWAIADGMGGAQSRGDKIADLLEAQEDAEKAATKRAIRDDLWNRSGSAWRSYQARTGQRVALTDLGKPRTGQRAVKAPSGSTAGSGGMWSNRD